MKRREKKNIFVKWILLSFLSICFVASGKAQNTISPDSTVKNIQQLYESGSYLAAELESRRLLESKTITDSLRIVAEEYIAFALAAQGKHSSAADHFLIVLSIDKNFDLDPVLTSPKIMNIFNEAKLKFLSQKKSKEDEVLIPQKILTPSVSYRVLLFPGWEQLSQGRTTAGYTLLGAGALSLGIAIYSEVQRSNTRTLYLEATTPELAASRYTRYNNFYKASVYSLSAFAAIYVYSEIDAFINLPQPSSVTLKANEHVDGMLVTFSFSL